MENKKTISNNNQHEKLFIVVLGGRLKPAHIELHDVRWVAAKSIEEAIPTLKDQWFGLQNGLHIDSYLEVRNIDGYKVDLIPINTKNNKIQKFPEKYLWFVNLGGYDPKQLAEQHQFRLVVAESEKEAKKIALSAWSNKIYMKHKDDIKEIRELAEIDECQKLQIIQNKWEIYLYPEPRSKRHEFKPDWYGYWRIDRQNPMKPNNDI